MRGTSRSESNVGPNDEECGTGIGPGHICLDHERADVHVGERIWPKLARNRGRGDLRLEILEEENITPRKEDDLKTNMV